VKAAVLTVSDGVAAGTRADESGDLLVALLAADGYEVERRTVPDDVDEIARVVTALAADASLVLTTGGTGVAPRDVTPEATASVVERLAPGISEAIRADAIAKTPHGLLSRGVAGVRGTALVVNLPGSTGGCRDVYAVLYGCCPERRQRTCRPDAVTRLYTDDVELYDIAFTWDIHDEVSWLLERFGPSCRTVFEPGSGTGRMLEALALRGLAPCGIDSSAAMVAFSRARLSEAGVHAGVMLADMTDFDLDMSFDAAVCPINTLSHLTEAELASHLALMAEHLEQGAHYLVQVGVFDSKELPPPNEWEAEREGTTLRFEWALLERDLAARRERHRSRLEVLAGPRKGYVFEELQEMTAWDSSTWRAAMAASPFTEVATYDGGQRSRPRIELEHGGGLMWHELVAP
jgi:molybdenum cofactor biosynthesis protein B